MHSYPQWIRLALGQKGLNWQAVSASCSASSSLSMARYARERLPSTLWSNTPGSEVCAVHTYNIMHKVYWNIVHCCGYNRSHERERAIQYISLSHNRATLCTVVNFHFHTHTNLSAELCCTSEPPWGSPPHWRTRFPRLYACQTPPSQGTTSATHSVVWRSVFSHTLHYY